MEVQLVYQLSDNHHLHIQFLMDMQRQTFLSFPLIKQVKRVYHCLVEGVIEDTGVIDKPIIKDSNSVKRLINEKGKKAVRKTNKNY